MGRTLLRSITVVDEYEVLSYCFAEAKLGFAFAKLRGGLRFGVTIT